MISGKGQFHCGAAICSGRLFAGSTIYTCSLVLEQKYYRIGSGAQLYIALGGPEPLPPMLAEPPPPPNNGLRPQ